MADPMTYRIDIEMGDNGWWTVDIPSVPGAHSEGQTLARARHNAREVIALMLNLPEGAEESIELEEHLSLPEGVRAVVESACSARREAEKAAEVAQQATQDALAALEKCLPDLGLRDRADLVGLSYQRVAQLRPGAPRRGRRPMPRRHEEDDPDLAWPVVPGPDLPYEGKVPVEVLRLASKRRRRS
jgi:predicted RNase H-like HicB family nuclease